MTLFEKLIINNWLLYIQQKSEYRDVEEYGRCHGDDHPLTQYSRGEESVETLFFPRWWVVLNVELYSFLMINTSTETKVLFVQNSYLCMVIVTHTSDKAI